MKPTWPHPCSPPAGPAPPPWPAQPTRAFPVVFLLGQKDEGVCPTLAGTRARHLPPCWPPPASPGLPRCPGRSHAAAPHRSHSPSPSSSPPALSPSHPKHCRRRSSSPTRSPPSPRPSVESPSSAATPSPSSPSKQPGRAPLHRNRRRLQASADKIAVVAPAAPSLPRARFDARCNRGELRHRSPLSI